MATPEERFLRARTPRFVIMYPWKFELRNLQENFGDYDNHIDDDTTPVKMAEVNRRRTQKTESKKRRRFHEEYEDTHIVLGRGALGSVHVYRHVKSGKDFAVKIIDKLGEERCQKVFREVFICRELQDCTSIINLVDFRNDTDKYFLVFERMGSDFHALLKSRGSLVESDASRVIAELASALQALHSRGIAHRDIKPANVLCVNDGCPTPLRLCDFDLASYTHSLVRRSGFLQEPHGFSSMVGTPEYIPPEVLDVMDKRPLVRYDVTCDLWSLGVLLYRILYGEYPFYGDCRRRDCPEQNNQPSCGDCDQVLYASIRRGEFGFPPADHTEISDRAKDLIQRLLVTDPSARLPASEILNHPFVTAHQDNGSHLTTEKAQES